MHSLGCIHNLRQPTSNSTSNNHLRQTTMARVLRSTKITISEDTSNEPTPDQQLQFEERKAETARVPLGPIEAVQEVVVSVEEAQQADEEKLLKAAFKSAIGVKKKKNKKDRRARAKQDTIEEAPQEDRAAAEETEQSVADEASKKDGEALLRLVNGMDQTHISAQPAPAAERVDITSIRNVPLAPRNVRSTRSQKNLQPAQLGQYNQHHHSYPRVFAGPPSYVRGDAGPAWSRGPQFCHLRPSPAIPFNPYHNVPLGGHRVPSIYAGPPPDYRTGLMSFAEHNRMNDSRHQLFDPQQQVQQWLRGDNFQPPSSRNANDYGRKVQEEAPKQEPVYVYVGEQRVASNSTVEVSVATATDDQSDNATQQRHISNSTAETAETMDVDQRTEESPLMEPSSQSMDVQEVVMEDNTAVSETVSETSTAQQEETTVVYEANMSETMPYPVDEPGALRSEQAASPQQEEHEDSFIEVIQLRSPVKPVRRRSSLDDIVAYLHASKKSGRENLGGGHLDFEDVIHRSPAKPVWRIEASTQKLEEVEDVIEDLNEVVAVANPMKPKVAATPLPRKDPLKSASSVTPSAAPRTTTLGRSNTVGARAGRALQSDMAAKKAVSGTATVRARTTDVRKSAVSTTSSFGRSASVRSISTEPSGPFATKRPLAKRPSSLLPSKKPVKSTRPVTRPAFELPGEKVARELKEKREAREARMAVRQAEMDADKARRAAAARAPTVRSTKPVNRPSYELPGDALSRKKREEREAKLRAEEKEEKKRREFKARPLSMSVRKSMAPAPRETAAGLARKSFAGSPAELGVKKRELRPTITEIDHENAKVAPRTRISSTTFTRKPAPAVTTHGPSMSGLSMQRSASNTSQNKPVSKGKEVYKRDALAGQNGPEETRANEEAAKRAREKAAEKGRQASREWAERQSVKMAGQKKGAEGQTA